MTQPFVTISEPACGAGAMMIAAVAEIQALGYMPSQHMWVSCVDIDVVAMSMAYNFAYRNLKQLIDYNRP